MSAAEHYVEADNLSVAWVGAIRILLAYGEAVPLVVSVTGFDDGRPRETTAVRDALEALLQTYHKQSCHTVANTIFPSSLWNPNKPRTHLYDRYFRLLPRLRAASAKNRHGLYFERLVSGGPKKAENQLEFAIGAYTARQGVRRSILQLAVFQPDVDHTTAAQRGFPCLQHVTFAPTDDGLAVNAFYASQYMVERAYGNYLGICRLGNFVAHELQIPLNRMTCFTGIALRDPGSRNSDLSGIVDLANGQH